MRKVYRRKIREPLPEEVERYEKVCKANPNYSECPDCSQGNGKLQLHKVVISPTSGDKHFIFKCSKCGYEEEGGF